MIVFFNSNDQLFNHVRHSYMAMSTSGGFSFKDLKSMDVLFYNRFQLHRFGGSIAQSCLKLIN